ncbi:iron-containing redox enzyme family protein [Mariniluteicoccus endophyticus]
MTTTLHPSSTEASAHLAHVSPRGALSTAILHVLTSGGTADTARRACESWRPPRPDHDHVLEDDDLQLSLLLLYGIPYGWFGPSADILEWDAALLGVRRDLESLLESDLRRRVGRIEVPEPRSRAVARALFDLTGGKVSPLSRFVKQRATREQLRELLVLRGLYTLREADPHSWAIPRVRGRAKAALVEIQADEYGNGDLGDMHSTLFAASMAGAGLSTDHLAHVDLLPARVLASHNTMSLFGLNRRLLGAIIGHLTAFEMTSATPNLHYRDGFARVGFGDDVTRYFAEHVQADAVHEQIAAHHLAGALAEDEPGRTADIMFGAAASLLVDGLVAEDLLAAWKEGRSALRGPLAPEEGAR